MKKIISILLSFVLVFSFGVTSFALESAEYYLDKIWERFADSSYHILDIRNDTRSLLSFVENINRNLDSIETTSNNFYESFFGDVVWGEPFGEVVQNSLNQIVDVLANPEDEQLKEYSQESKETIINNFFNPSSGNSLDSTHIHDLSGFITEFKSVFNANVFNVPSPFVIFQSDSQALLWFSESTALAIDPEFSGGGGGIEPDPDDPNPDEPDPDDPNPDEPDPDDPNPDEPDPDEPNPDEPDPEVTATPTISYNSATFTVTASGVGTVLMYVDGVQVSNPYTFTQTSSSVTYFVTATAQEEGKLISSVASLNVTVEALEPEPEPEPVVNLVLSATTSVNSSSIYNGTGYKDGIRLRLSGSTLNEVSLNGYCSTGYIRLDSSVSNTLYIYGFVKGSYGNIFYTSSGLSWDDVTIPSPDTNGVITVTIPSGSKAVRISSNSLGSSLICSLEYPIKTTASTFSLRNRNFVNSNEVVTNYYGARNYLFNLLLGWGD